MGKELRHEGKRRGWFGKVDTLCGLVLPADAKGNWFALSATCPDCRQARKARRHA